MIITVPVVLLDTVVMFMVLKLKVGDVNISRLDSLIRDTRAQGA